MKYIKDGKIVLNGTYRYCDLENMILEAMEIIVDKNIDIILFKNSTSCANYNLWRRDRRSCSKLKASEFKLLKEIGIIW